MKRVWSFLLPLFVAMNTYYPIYQEGKVLKCQVETGPKNQLWIVPEKMAPDPMPDMGTQEIPRSDGGKDTTYYSTVTPEEEKKTQQGEREKEEKSLDSLKNIIIDGRRTR